MASWPSGLRIGAEGSTALSHPITPTTSDPYSLRDEDFDHDLGKEKLDYSTRKLLEAMASGSPSVKQLDDPLPLHVSSTAGGRVEDGLYPPEFYEYADGLLSCTWKEGLTAIESYEWGRSTSEVQRKQDEAYREVQRSTNAVEEWQTETLLSDAASQSSPHSASLGVDDIEAELSFDEGLLHAGPTTSALICASLPRALHREGPAAPSLLPPTPPKASENGIESSPPWTESHPWLDTVTPGVIISTMPLKAADTREPIAHPSLSSTLLSNKGAADSMLQHDSFAEKASGVEDMQGAIEGHAKLLVQSPVLNLKAIPPLHGPDRAATPSNTAVDQLGADRPIERQVPNNQGTLTEAQPETNVTADETESNDWDSLFDYYPEESEQNEQQHDKETDVTCPLPETAESVNMPAQASPADTNAVSNSSEVTANDNPIQPTLHDDDDDFAAQMLAGFNSADQRSPTATLLEGYLSEVVSSTEAPALPSNTSESAPNYGLKASVEHQVDADGVGRSVASEGSLVPSLQDQLPFSPPEVAPQLQQHDVPEQGSFTEVVLTEAIKMRDRNEKVDRESPQHNASKQESSTEVALTKEINMSDRNDKVDVGIQKETDAAVHEVSLVPLLQKESHGVSPGGEIKITQQNVFAQGSCSNESQAEHNHMDVKSEGMDLTVQSNSNPTSKDTDEWHESQHTEPAKDTHLPQQNSLKQALLPSDEVKLPRDTQDANESDSMTKSEEAGVPGEDTVSSSSPDREVQRSPFKLKIRSQIWNAASRDGSYDDVSPVEGRPMAPAPTLGNAMAEPQVPDDTGNYSEINSSDKNGSVADHATPEKTPSGLSVSGEESPNLPAVLRQEGTLANSVANTPQPLLPGLEEHAAAAASSSTIAPSYPTAMAVPRHDQSSPWAGTLLEQQLDLPPSPYTSGPATGALPVETCYSESDTSLGAEASFKDGLQAEPADALLPVSTQDSSHGTPESFHVPTKDESFESLSSPESELSDLEAYIEATLQQSTPKAVPMKRMHPATNKKARANPDANVEYQQEESSGSDYEAPAKKIQKKMSGEASTTTPRSKGNTKLGALSKSRRGKKPTRHALEEEVIDRDDTEAEMDGKEHTASTENGASTTHQTTSSRPRYWALNTDYLWLGKRVTRGDVNSRRVGDTTANTSPVQGAVQTHEEEEILVDAEPNAATDGIAPVSQAKAKRKATATLAKAPKTPRTTVSKPAPRKITAQTPAKAPLPKSPATASSNTPEAATKRSKFGFKPPNGRKRKSTEAADDDAETPRPSSAQTHTKRQTRQASAKREEWEKQMEIETNVAKRTRGARKSQ